MGLKESQPLIYDSFIQVYNLFEKENWKELFHGFLSKKIFSIKI
jgi:hypothetical protein